MSSKSKYEENFKAKIYEDADMFQIETAAKNERYAMDKQTTDVESKRMYNLAKYAMMFVFLFFMGLMTTCSLDERRNDVIREIALKNRNIELQKHEREYKKHELLRDE